MCVLMNAYQAAIMRNPVTNLPAMANVTDIPDWCVVEAGAAYDWEVCAVPDGDLLKKMHEMSPTFHAHKVRKALRLPQPVTRTHQSTATT